MIQLVPYVKGQVRKVHAQPNQPMKKGDLLLEIDPTPYQNTLDQVQAQLQVAKENEKTYASITGRGRLNCTRVNMLGLVITLSNTLGAPVQDETGLTGFYDFSLEWADPLSQRPGAQQRGDQQTVDSSPDIFRAVEEQLGLKLNAKKGPVEILVIDKIERPSDN